MSKRSMRKLRGICSDALRAASLSAEFIAFGQANTHFSRIEGLERLRFKKRSRHCPAIAQALGLLSSSALPSCATDRLSARDRAEINQGERLTYRVQSAPRSLSARCETFDNQQGKDVKAKQHWCPLKQDHPTVTRLLHEMDYSLQANRKTKEGRQHPDRDAQFEQINNQVLAFERRGQPVISVDAKKRELIGDFKQSGRKWRPSGEPVKVSVYDFEDKELGHAIPYGVYDLTHNEGWVSVGIDHDPAE